MEEANRLRELLPPDVQATLLRHEAAGTTDSAEYIDAEMVFYHRHVCIPDPFPEYVTRSFDKLAANPEVYHTMNGPSEFHVIGTLKEWNVIPRLGEIAGTHAGHVGPPRRGDAAHREHRPAGHPGRRVGDLRALLAHGARGGAGAVHGGAGRVPVQDRGRRHVRRDRAVGGGVGGS